LSETLKKLRAIFTRREKLQISVLLLALIVMALSQAVGVVSVLPFIGLVMEPNLVFDNRWLFWVYETFNFTSVNRFIIFAGVAMFIAILSANIISALTTWMKLRFVWMNNHRLSRRLLEKYLSMPYIFFLNHNSSDLSKNILSEVNHLTSSYLIPLLTILTRGLVALFLLIMLLWVDVVVSLMAIVFIGGSYTAIYWRVNRNLKARGEIRLKANQMRYKAVSEAFGGIKELKVMHREHYFIENYSRESFKQALQMAWNAVITWLPRFALEAIAFGGIIIFVLVLLLSRQDIQQIIPIVSVFAFAGYRLMPALQDIFGSFTQMRFNQPVLDRIYEDVISSDNSVSEQFKTDQAMPEPLPFSKEIRLEEITYYYPNTTNPVIEDINLSIKYNTAIAFVGPTGAGKTTLADIILGLLPPRQGRLLIDGLEVDQANLARWQRTIGYVPQHIYLSDNTIAANIAFGLNESEIDRAALERVARIANIYDFIIEELPAGFDTIVGERGIRLSGGQRQRIGIARALYQDPEVLVFDEATSALDGATEDAVLQAMENAARQKTLIIIAHRLSTVNNCDQIYLLDRGKIVASGSYEELLETNEQFQKMAKVGSDNYFNTNNST